MFYLRIFAATLFTLLFARFSFAENIEFPRLFADFAKIPVRSEGGADWNSKPSYIQWEGSPSTIVLGDKEMKGTVELRLNGAPTYGSEKTGENSPWTVTLRGVKSGFAYVAIQPAVEGIDPEVGLPESLIAALSLTLYRCKNELVIEGNRVYRSGNGNSPIYVVEHWSRGSAVADISFDILMHQKDADRVVCAD